MQVEFYLKFQNGRPVLFRLNAIAAYSHVPENEKSCLKISDLLLISGSEDYSRQLGIPKDFRNFAIYLPGGIQRSDSGLETEDFATIDENDTELSSNLLLSKLTMQTHANPLIITLADTYDYEGTEDSIEGLPAFIFSNRSKTIEIILSKIVDLKRIVYSAPPMSGKSATCTLLSRRFKATFQRSFIVRLNCSGIDCDIDFDQFKFLFFEKTKLTWDFVLSQRGCLLILDDAHILFQLDVYLFNLAIMGIVQRRSFLFPFYYLNCWYISNFVIKFIYTINIFSGSNRYLFTIYRGRIQ